MNNLLITGYRAHELGIFGQKHKGIPFIRKAIESKLIPLVEEGLEWVITPGQYGVDLWACESVIALKKNYPQLRLSILTAFEGQEEKWSEDKQEYYRDILKNVDYYAAVSKQPYSGPWQFTARDDLLLRKTEGIILVYDEEAGDASPKFMKEKALRKNREDGYLYLAVSSEDIQSAANEEQYEMADGMAGADNYEDRSPDWNEEI
ncbi:DUF1273 domain-containing protein [Cohnella hashimotonis]|uniref:DUF1273 domain-containing protein n=1 Tax=Cohnella hashimotonis TaxID=2826895 RepID=A0ABT6TTR7_9BACL|nr:DUF1273 domain-containing protein [Cohnella hashimotonis]MDI4650238.1 DUF1273 domain-containing protein [Cohnella hashimotonis]